MALTGNYSWLNVKADILIQDAFERIGIPAEKIEYQKFDSCLKAINILLSSWMARDIQLWTLSETLFPLNENQYQYSLDEDVLDIVQCSLVNSKRQLNGASSTLNIGDIFEDEGMDPCTQTSSNGTISYNFTAGSYPNNKQKITLIGIRSNETLSYLLKISCDNQEVMILPESLYTKGVTKWFFLNQGTIQGEEWAITETGGATLNIQKIFFNNNIQKNLMTSLSRFDYKTMPNADRVGRPASYYLDRQVKPQLYIWPAPLKTYSLISFSATHKPEDVVNQWQVINIPSQFYDAFCWSVAFQMAIKYSPDKIQLADQYAKLEYSIAEKQASEKTNWQIDINFRKRYR